MSYVHLKNLRYVQDTYVMYMQCDRLPKCAMYTKYALWSGFGY